MKRLIIFCEGPTVQGFCKQLLLPHLIAYNISIHTILIAHSKRHGTVSRGGVPAHYVTMRRDIQNELNRHRTADVLFSTLIDLYGLPSDFTGKESQIRKTDDPVRYVTALEAAFGDDIADQRFIPYLQLHEFETLLFTDPESFRIEFDHCDRAIEELKTIASSFPSIEHIDDGQRTCPSRRIIELIPAYEGKKRSAGPDIAFVTGIPAIRAKCPHFSSWLTRLEELG